MKILFHTGATIDLESADEWYETEQPGLGDELRAEIDRALAIIAENPNAWPKWPDLPPNSMIRRFVLARFPYAIAFVIDAERVVVLAIAHTRRRPYWLRRSTDTTQ